MSNKKNIKNFGKSFEYLQAPELRKKETGDTLLTFEDAEIRGVDFQGLDWRNVKFVNCDFIGAYEVKLAAMDDCMFEGCRFSGIFAWGVQNRVRFVGCTVAGASHLWGAEESKAVFYEQCSFAGTSPERNHWGSVGTYGEAAFFKCSGKWMGVLGHSSLVIQDCTFESMDCKIDASESKGVVPVTLIQGSKLRGTFDMVSTSLQSLTIRDTVVDNLDLSGAVVKGDVVIERVRGGTINAYVKEARSLSVRNSQIYGNGQKIFEAYAGGIRSIEIDTVIFGGDFSTEPVSIAGGTGADLSNVRARVNDSIVIRKSKVPRLSTHHVNTASYRLESCEIDNLDLSNSRIAALELTGNTIKGNVDFTNTQVKDGKVQTFAKGRAKLDGSNVKID